jgi:hypothetical protein
MFEDIAQLEQLEMARQVFSPGPDAQAAHIAYEGWQRAIRQLGTVPPR